MTLITSVWISAQSGKSNETFGLFPSGDDFMAAAQYGYRSETNLELAQVHGHFPGMEGKITDCLPHTQSIGLAGPLMLAAMQGRTAHLNSKPMPEREDLVHVQGALMVLVESYSLKKEDRAEIWLAQGTQEIRPVSEKLDAAKLISCNNVMAHGKQVHTAGSVWDVRQFYAFRFPPGTPQPDWTSPIRISVQKNGKEEKYETNFGDLLSRDAEKLH